MTTSTPRKISMTIPDLVRPFAEVLISAGLETSVGEAMLHIRSGAVSIDGVPLTNIPAQLVVGKPITVTVGKRRKAVIEIN